MAEAASRTEPEQQPQDRQSRDAEADAPFVMAGDRRVRIAVVDYGLIPPWDGFRLREWWRQSRFNPARESGGRG